MAINGDVILYILILLWPNDCLPSLSLSFLVSLSVCLLLSPEMDVDACSIFCCSLLVLCSTSHSAHLLLRLRTVFLC